MGDYLKLHGGDIEFYKFMAGEHRLHRDLKRWESGTALNGEWTEIPGYWLAEPKILLTPANINSCKDARMVDQQLTVKVSELEEFSPNRWRFKPEALLSWLPGGSFSTPVDYRVSGADITDFTPEYLTSDSCIKIAVNFQVASKKNTNTDGTFHQRLVDVYLFVDGVQAGMETVSLGETTLYVKGTVSSGVLAAGQHRVKIKAEGRDSGATFKLYDEVFEYTPITYISNSSRTEEKDSTVRMSVVKTGQWDKFISEADADGYFNLHCSSFKSSYDGSVYGDMSKGGIFTYTCSPSAPALDPGEEGEWEIVSHLFKGVFWLYCYFHDGGTGHLKFDIKDAPEYSRFWNSGHNSGEWPVEIVSTEENPSFTITVDLATQFNGGDSSASAVANVQINPTVTTTWKLDKSIVRTEIQMTPVQPIPMESTSAIVESVTEYLGGDSELAAGTVNYIAIGE